MEYQLFETLALSTLERVKQTFCERAGQYGDTYKDCQWLVMKATFDALGLKIPDEYCMAIGLAAYVDQKYQRNQGGFREDSWIDNTAYLLALTEAIRRIKESQEKLPNG